MTTSLRAGELVEVKSLKDILATLDANGALEGMPFMPEMVPFCSKRFRVAQRAHKTCNTVDNTGGARIERTVHLEGVRCDGASHGRCQAFCLMFWKEAWLKRVSKGEDLVTIAPNRASESGALPERWSYKTAPGSGPGPVCYRCQITDIPVFTTYLNWWDIRQYIEDITAGNVGLLQLFRGVRFAFFRAWLHHGVGYRLTKSLYNWYQRQVGGNPFPFVAGTLEKTPKIQLNLQPGELVRVKTFDDIIGTLDASCKNRGLGFDTCEMGLHCKKTYRVKARIERILNEKTGEMMVFSNPCITLEGVYCSGETTQRRLFCPRAITPYWREAWLERVSSAGEEAESERVMVAAHP